MANRTHQLGVMTDSKPKLKIKIMEQSKKVIIELSLTTATDLSNFLNHFKSVSKKELDEAKEFNNEVPNNHNMFCLWEDVLDRIDEVEEQLRDKSKILKTKK